MKAGVCSKENVQEILLISAKTGYGIERLITKMHKNWGTQGDVYILGEMINLDFSSVELCVAGKTRELGNLVPRKFCHLEGNL